MTDKRSVELTDLYQMKWIEDPRISPDGQWVVYVRVDLDKASNGYKRNLWLVKTDGHSPAIQLTRSGKDSHPRWSGNRLAFLSGRGEKPQIFLIATEAPGGEPRALTSHPQGVTSFTWSHDGTQIAFLAAFNPLEDRDEETPPADKLEGKYRTERREEDEKKKIDPRVVRQVPYRVGTAYLSDRFSQIYVINAVDESAKARRLTGEFANFQEPQWSPDGQYLYTARAVDPAADEPFRQSRLYRIRLEDGLAEPIQHLANYTDVQPIPSPDGKWIAYLRFPDDRASMRINRLAVIPVSGGEARDLNLTSDRQASIFRWVGDGLVFFAEWHGSSHVYRVAPQGGDVTLLTPGVHRMDGFDVHQSGLIAYAASTPTHLPELYLQRPDQSDPVRLTTLNQPLLDQVQVQPPQHLVYQAPDGYTLEGWYFLPVGYQAGEQYPLIVNVHGGPHIMWGPSDPNMWLEWQSFAARGYAMFFCNPRGSGGYGEAHQMAVYKSWGEIPLGDILAGVDALSAKGFVDSSRVGITGGSYGGYMTTWALSQTDRFKAGVTQRGVYNLLSFFGTSDIPSFVRDEMGYLPMDNPQFLWEHSPLAHAHKIKVPVLIMHAENDFRVAISESEQLFGYLRRAGTIVEFVRYPREGHELTRTGEPEHRIDHIDRTLAWFDRYCK
ncbi:MAG: S9 family peptidase [Anaerolineae bacterium]|nr:S9 family peptidase [Anaerolineae bacterium]